MVRVIFGAVALLSLLACLVAPFLYLGQTIGEAEFKTALLIASAAYLVSGILWVSRAGRGTTAP